ncbi:MAG: hypothetical protein R3F14_23715 [Polyangiaceae bacterium]
MSLFAKIGLSVAILTTVIGGLVLVRAQGEGSGAGPPGARARRDSGTCGGRGVAWCGVAWCRVGGRGVA